MGVKKKTQAWAMGGMGDWHGLVGPHKEEHRVKVRWEPAIQLQLRVLRLP
jgi:hypothetical protein